MLRIVPFGGCFVQHPAHYVSTKMGDQPLFARMGLKGSVFSLSANMNLQLIDFLTGEIQFPEWLKNLAYSKFVEQPSEQQGRLVYGNDIALVGLSTPVELVYGGAILNVNNFDAFISAELTDAVADRKALNRWKGALIKSNEDLLKSAAKELHGLIPKDTPERELIADFVLGISPRTLSIDEMTEKTAELRDRLGIPMAFALYNFMWMPDGRVVQWPADFKDNCIEVARRLNLRTIDYAPHVAQWGVDRVLMDDRRHFSPPSFPLLGELLYEFCLEVLDRPRASKAALSGSATERPRADENKSVPSATSPIDQILALGGIPPRHDVNTDDAHSAATAALAGEVEPDSRAARRYALDDLSPAAFTAKLHERRVARALQDIEAAWHSEDYAAVACRSRDLIELEPGNVRGLTYLARAGAFVGDWADVARAGAALTRESPREAFLAAGKLNRAGRALEAARIFVELKLHDDWFDDEAKTMARTDARLLQRAGTAASATGDAEALRVIWVAGARLQPQSHFLTTRARLLMVAVKNTLANLDIETDRATYIDAYREMLWLNPSNKLAAVRLARAADRSNEQEAIDAWLKVLAIEPDHPEANILVRRLAARGSLEDYAIQGLTALGWDEASAPSLRELIDQRDANARADRKVRLRQALRHASEMEAGSDSEGCLKAWKEVLGLDPTQLGAAKKVIVAAGQAGDYPALVDALLIHLEIAPGDARLSERLAAAALRAGEEQRVLEYLVRRGTAELLSKSRFEGLRSRVFAACRSALNAPDYSLARVHFRTLALVDEQHPSLEPLGVALANGLAASAFDAEKRNDFAEVVLLAEQALDLVPDHPVALLLMARDFWRQERFGELMAFCQPRVKEGRAYEAVQTMLEKAMFAA